METNSPHRVLIFDFILFLFFGILIWIINVIGQSAFPGNNLFPFLMRSTILLVTVTVAYYLNYRFSKKNLLNFEVLKFNVGLIRYHFGGVILGCVVIATIWAVVYLIYPFEIVKNPNPKINLAIDIVSYTFGNTLEELLFRAFLLLASVQFFGKMGGVLFVSLLFGLFHLQGAGLTFQGLSMVLTTYTMSLLFISVMYYAKSIWPAVTLHITGNLLLHSLGLDGANNGMFQIEFAASNTNGLLLTFVYEIVVISFALIFFIKAEKLK